MVADVKMYEDLTVFYKDKFQELYEWGCKAENGISSDVAESTFSMSWGAQNHIHVILMKQK